MHDNTQAPYDPVAVADAATAKLNAEVDLLLATPLPAEDFTWPDVKRIMRHPVGIFIAALVLLVLLLGSVAAYTLCHPHTPPHHL